MATEDTQDVSSSVERELSTLKSAYNQSQAFRRRFDVAPVATPKACDSRGDASADFQGEHERDGAEESCQTTEEGHKIPYIRKDFHRGESFMNMPTRLSESLKNMNQSFRDLDVSERLCSIRDSFACLMQGEE